MKWVPYFFHQPTRVGWYAFTWCHDSREGLFISTVYWDGTQWSKDITAVIFISSKSFESEELASEWAYANDLETMLAAKKEK